MTTRYCSHCQHKRDAGEVAGLPPRCGMCRDAIADGEPQGSSCFGGQLVRCGGVYYYADGERADGVEPWRPSDFYNFRCGPGVVEVPVGLTRSEEDLRWAGECGFPQRAGRYLVPLEVWDEFDRTTAIGVRWPREIEGTILAKIEQLRGRHAAPPWSPASDHRR